MGNTMRVPTEFTAIDKFSSVVQKMTSGVVTFSKASASAVNRVNSKVNGMFKSMDSLSQLAIGGGISAGFLMAGKSVMDYEDALASLEAVTGEKASKFKAQIESIAKTTGKSAIDVAGSFEIIGSAMSQYLSDPKSLGQISEAGITLSKAAKMDLEPALESLTSVMNQFDLSAKEANKTINILTAGEIVGSVSTQKIANSLQEFGANAFAANVKLSESVALLETMGKQMDHSKIGVGARNLLSVMSSAKGLPKPAIESLAKHGVSLDLLMNKTKPLSARLKELSKVQGDAVAMVNIFGKENMTAAQVVFKNLATYDKWQKTIEKTNKAQEQASVNSATLSKVFERIKNSFTNAIVSGDGLNSTLFNMKSVGTFIADNMGTILSVVLGLITAFTVFKAIVIASTVATFAYNVGLGIMGALSGTASVAIGASTVALNAYKIASGIATAAQWLFNAALTANPIGIIIMAIAALIAIIYNWSDITDWFGKQWETFTNWIGGLWDGLVSWFQNFSFSDFFKGIGQSIIEFLLTPLKWVLEVIAKIPGKIGDMAKGGLKTLNEIDITGKKDKLESPEAKQAKATANATVNGKVDINVAAKGGAEAKTTSTSGGGIPVRVTPTQGAFGK